MHISPGQLAHCTFSSHGSLNLLRISIKMLNIDFFVRTRLNWNRCLPSQSGQGFTSYAYNRVRIPHVFYSKQFQAKAIMNIKSLFEPVDSVIAQARSFIHEQDVRKKYLKQIDEKIAAIKPELEKRKFELTDLLEKIETESQFKERMRESLNQVDCYLGHIELIAEKELALEIVKKEQNDSDASKREEREKYVALQINRLEEQLKNTNNFFEVADFANEIWADFDLFEEFGYDETVVQFLVDRMNATNAKNTETRMGRDLRKILEHIRLNLVKSTAWSNGEVKDYQAERDLKLNQLQTVKIPTDKNFNVCLFGAGEEIIGKMYELYALPKRLKLKWYDIEEENATEALVNSQVKNDLALFLTMYPNHSIFKKIKETLTELHIPFVDIISFGTEKVLKVLEAELIRIRFEKEFARK